MNGQQLLCIEEAVPADSTASSVHLHLSEQMLFVYSQTQVRLLMSRLLHLSVYQLTCDFLVGLGKDVLPVAAAEGVAAGRSGAPPQQ